MPQVNDALRDGAATVYSSLPSVSNASKIRNTNIAEWTVEETAQMAAAYCSHGHDGKEKVESNIWSLLP